MQVRTCISVYLRNLWENPDLGDGFGFTYLMIKTSFLFGFVWMAYSRNSGSRPDLYDVWWVFLNLSMWWLSVCLGCLDLDLVWFLFIILREKHQFGWWVMASFEIIICVLASGLPLISVLGISFLLSFVRSIKIRMYFCCRDWGAKWFYCRW